MLGITAIFAYVPSPSLSSTFLPDDPNLAVVIQKWDEYLGLTHSIQGSVETRGLIRIPGEPERTSYNSGDVKRNNKSALRRSRWQRENQDLVEVSATNERYSFALRRSQVQDAWVLTGFGVPTRSTNTVGDAWHIIQGVIDAPLTIIGPREFLPDLLVDRDFKVLKLSMVDLSGQQIMRVDFQNVPKVVPEAHSNGVKRYGGYITLVKGYVLLDPTRYYVLSGFAVECEFGKDDRAHVEGKFSYEKHGSAVPLLKEVIRDYKSDNGATSRWVNTYKLSDSPANNDEFTLSAFGLPEPATERSVPRTSWHIWFIVAALGCIGMALALRYVARSRALASRI